MLKGLLIAISNSLNEPIEKNKALAEQAKLVKRAVRDANRPYVNEKKK